MNISTDQIIFWQHGPFVINATLFYTWFVMILLALVAFLTKRSVEQSKVIGRMENFFEILVDIIGEQIKSITNVEFNKVFPFITTLFLFIFMSNLISLIPGFSSPTASLSTTFALMFLVVTFSVGIGIKNKGFKKYMSKYIEPVKFMLPLNIIGDIVSNFSLAFRLYGNIMSGGIVATILAKITFLSIGFPVIISLLGSITGLIQAYVFSILSMIFLSSADN